MIKTLKLKQIKMKKQNNSKEETTMNKKFGLMLIASMIVFNGSVMAVEIDAAIPDEITVTDEEYELLQEALLIDFEEEPIATAAGYKSYHKAGDKTGKKAISPGKRGKSRLPYFEKGGKKYVRFTKGQKRKLAKTFGFRARRSGKSLKGSERKSGISKLSREKRKRVAKALGFKDVASLEALVQGLDGDEAVEEIEMEEYLRQLENQVEKKNRLLKEKNHFKRKSKLAKYLINRGFESNLVWEKIKEIYNK